MNETVNFHKNVAKDINLDDLYSALVQCFSIVICGYAAGRLNLISPRETRGLDVFIRTFSLPSVIFLSLAQLDMSSVNWKFLASILVSKSIVFVGVIVVTICLNRPVHYGKLGLFAVFCTQSNDFALGYPILNALYGKEHPTYPSYVYLLAPISLLFLNPIAFVLLEIGKFQNEKEDSERIEIPNSPDDKTATFNIQPQQASESNIEQYIEGRTDEMQNIATEENAQVQQENSMQPKSGKKFFILVFLNIVSNPVIIMTTLGISANFIYRYIQFVGVILKAFASVFSTTALFVLGIRTVGTVHKLKGIALITTGILIITKLLVLPLVTREVVSLLRPGTNANDTLNLSSFGFMYGTFPTAPMAFVFATQYDLEIETVSSSLMVCTFLSAPLIYISAKMIFMDYLPYVDYLKKLQSFQYNIAIFGIPLGVWLLILFIANKSFSKVPHKITGFLIISQILLCVGVILQPFAEDSKSWFAHIHMCIVAVGLYSSRIWTCFLAVTLMVLQSKSLCFLLKLVPVFIAFAWGLPVLLVGTVCYADYPNHPFQSLIHRGFRHNLLESIINVVFLSVFFVGTSICLILQHRYQKRFAKYLVLVQDINSRDLNEVNETNIGETSYAVNSLQNDERLPKVTDIEGIGSDADGNVCNGQCEDKEDLCSSEFNCSESEREVCEQTIRQYNEQTINESIDEDHQDRQIVRHIVLLLILVTSMFVSLMLSIWTLVVEDAISGVYIELLFLSVLLNTGQIYLTFAVFGFESRGLFVPLTNRWRKFYYGADTVVLTPVEALGFETTHVCHQFIAHHLQSCEKDIAQNKRLRLRMYKNCFKGKSLVLWLQTKHLAKDEVEAVQYASHLLEGRVLRHVENRYRFENSDLLYTFKQ